MASGKFECDFNLKIEIKSVRRRNFRHCVIFCLWKVREDKCLEKEKLCSQTKSSKDVTGKLLDIATIVKDVWND